MADPDLSGLTGTFGHDPMFQFGALVGFLGGIIIASMIWSWYLLWKDREIDGGRQ